MFQIARMIRERPVDLSRVEVNSSDALRVFRVTPGKASVAAAELENRSARKVIIQIEQGAGLIFFRIKENGHKANIKPTQRP